MAVNSSPEFWSFTLDRLERLHRMAKVYELQGGRMNVHKPDFFVACQCKHIEFPKFDEQDPVICELQVKILKTLNKTLSYSFLLDYMREGFIHSWLGFLDVLLQMEEPKENDQIGLRRRTYALKVLVGFALYYEVMIQRSAAELYGRRMLVRDIFQHKFVKTVINYSLEGNRIPSKALMLIFIYCKCYIQGMAVEFPDLIDDMVELVKRHFTATVGETRKSTTDGYLPIVGHRPVLGQADLNAWHDCEPLDTTLYLPDSPLWALLDLIGALIELDKKGLTSSAILGSLIDSCENSAEGGQKMSDTIVAIALQYHVTADNRDLGQMNKLLEMVLKCLRGQDGGVKETASWCLASIVVHLKEFWVDINQLSILDSIRPELIKCLQQSTSSMLKDATISLVHLSKLDAVRFKLDDETICKILPRLTGTHHKVTELLLDFMHLYPECVRKLSETIFEALQISYKSSYDIMSVDGWRRRSLLLGIMLKFVNQQDIFGLRSESDEATVLDTWIDFNQDSRNDEAGFYCQDKRLKIYHEFELHNFLKSRRDPENIDRLFPSITAALHRGRNVKTVMSPIKSYLLDTDLGEPVPLRLMNVMLDSSYTNEFYLFDFLLNQIMTRLSQKLGPPELLEVLDRTRRFNPKLFEMQRERLYTPLRNLFDKLYPKEFQDL